MYLTVYWTAASTLATSDQEAQPSRVASGPMTEYFRYQVNYQTQMKID